MLFTNSRSHGVEKNLLFLSCLGISLTGSVTSPLAWGIKSGDSIFSTAHEKGSLSLNLQRLLPPASYPPPILLTTHVLREGVQHPCVPWFYLLFIDRSLAWLKTKAENFCLLLPFRKSLPGEVQRCPHSTWQHAWRKYLLNGQEWKTAKEIQWLAGCGNATEGAGPAALRDSTWETLPGF